MDFEDVLVVLGDFFTMLLLILVSCLWAIVRVFLPTSLIGKCLDGKTVLITGAAGGLGRHLAREFGLAGCNLVLWDVNTQANEDLAEEAKSVWGVSACAAYTVDLCNRKNVYAAAQKVQRDVGFVDILVNCAGLVNGKTFLDSLDDRLELTIKVNLLATFWTVKAFLPAMMEQDNGHIVNIASSAGIFGAPGMVEYCASKFGLVGFDEALREEITKSGKSVNTTVVCPYLIKTEMFTGCRAKLLPTAATSKLMDFFGGSTMMDDYEGKQLQQPKHRNGISILQAVC